MNSSSLIADSQRLRRACWLVLVLAVGGWLRCAALLQSLWIDELHTAWVVSGSWSDISTRATLGNNGPLYFGLVYLTTQLTGLHEWGLRSISICAGMGLIGATYWMMRQWKVGFHAALLATALVAMDSNAVYFSCEARPYALVQLFSLLHLYLFWHLVEKSPATGAWIAWIVTAATMFHLHCTSGLVFVAEAAAYGYFFVFRRSTLQLHPILFCLGLAAIGLSTMPAIGLLHQVAAHRHNWEMFVPKQDATALLTIYPLYLYVGLAFGVGALARLMQRDLSDDVEESPWAESTLVVCVAWLVIPLLAAWLLTQTDLARLFFRRYLIASSVALALLSALLVTLLAKGHRVSWKASLAMVVLGLATISPARHIHRGWNALAHSAENWRGAVAMLNRKADNEPLLFYSGLIEADQWYDSADQLHQQYCEFPLRGIYPLTRSLTLIQLPKTQPIRLTAAQMREIVDQGAVWLLIRGRAETVSVVKNDVLSALSGGFRELESHTLGHLTVVRFGTITSTARLEKAG